MFIDGTALALGWSCDDRPVRHIVVGTAGHIDHGKSTLVEALTGVDPDRLIEEKARGITIDLGFAPYLDGETALAFVDVPGHERFVRNMLAGASGIDCVLLVVAADESIMPQTREHFDICRLLGVETGAVALTKADLVDDETLELVQLETRELVDGSFLAGAPIVPVSARTGAGIDALRAVLARLAEVAPGRPDDGLARLPIDRAFSVRGFGTVVTGTQVAGRIRTGADLIVMPGGRRTKVRGLQVHGAARSVSHAGQRVALNLAGVDVDDLERGDTLAEVAGLEATRRIDAVVTLLPSARALKHGARVRFHQGTTEIMARVALGAEAGSGGNDARRALEADGASGADAGGFPALLAPGGRAYARLHLERPASVTRGDRFVMRAYSPPLTIAGGTVLDPRPPRGRLRSASGRARCQRLAATDDTAAAVRVMVEESGGEGISRTDVTSRAGLSPGAAEALEKAFTASGDAVAIGGRLVAPDRLREIRGTLVEAISAFHRAQPLEAGLPREEARERLRRRASAAVFDHVVAELVSDGTVVATGHLALASHRVSLSPAEQRVHDVVEGLFVNAGLAPPDRAELAAASSAGDEVLDRMVRLLIREGRLERVDALLFSTDALDRLRREVAALGRGAEQVRIDVAAFKDRYGVTRKFAIPLLEHLDRMRVTRRVGRERIVL